MRKQLILHIGRHKTGTSALQKFFSGNSCQLKYAGWLYPLSMRATKSNRVGIAHHGLANHFRIKKNAAWLPDEDNSALNSQSDFDQLADEIKSQDKILISSESLQNLNPAVMSDFLNQFNLTIVVYIREQLDYLLSAYAQAVHAKRITYTIEEFAKKRYENINYHTFLSRWKNAFPGSSLVVRVYERGRLAKHDIRHDFIQCSPLKEKLLSNRLTFESSDANPSIGGDLLEFKRQLNSIEYSDLIPQGKNLYAMLGKIALADECFQSKPYVTPEFFYEYRNRFCDINLEVSRDFFSGASELFCLKPYDAYNFSSSPADFSRIYAELNEMHLGLGDRLCERLGG